MTDYPQVIILRPQQGLDATLLTLDYTETEDGPAIPIDAITTQIREHAIDRSKDESTWSPVITTIDWTQGDDDQWEGAITAEHSSLLTKGVAYHYDVFVEPTDGDPVVPIVGLVITGDRVN